MKGSWKKSPYVRLGITLFCAAAAFLLFFKVISDFSGVMSVFSTIGGILMPFIVGLVLAYLLSPIYDAVERFVHWMFTKKNNSPSGAVKATAKVIASVVSMLFLAAVVVGLISLVIPQAYASIINLINTFPQKQEAFEMWVMNISGDIGGRPMMNGMVEAFRIATDAVHQWVNNFLVPNLGNFAVQGMTYMMDIIGSIINVLVGVIICVYVLNSKKLFAAQAKKVTYSLCKTSTANYIIHMTRYIDHTFGHFINGMLLDALMVGVVCFIGMTILQMPYALLVSTIVGVFNVVPVFGPIVAAAIGAFFVLMDSPFKALIFLAFVLALQQIDGNIIAPKILGGKTGLRGFWVIFAIVVGGGLFGFTGMILGVPTFAVLYTLFQQKVIKRLRKKNIPAETEAYDGLWEVDEQSGELRYDAPDGDVAFPQKHQKDE